MKDIFVLREGRLEELTGRKDGEKGALLSVSDSSPVPCCHVGKPAQVRVAVWRDLARDCQPDPPCVAGRELPAPLSDIAGELSPRFASSVPSH